MYLQNCFILVSILAFSANQGKEHAGCNTIILYCILDIFKYFVALASSCQVHPSEYAYPHDSVNEDERASANCRKYPSGLQTGVFTESNIHCDGTMLILTDSNLGTEQYSSSAYYVWRATRDGQLLFIFPTRVSLTTITLHYYSDSVRGLPRLKFYAVADDFDVWDAQTTGAPNAAVTAVPPGGEPAGRRNVSINVNFNTKKVLMYKYSSTYVFAVSEVELFKCKQFNTACSSLYWQKQYLCR